MISFSWTTIVAVLSSIVAAAFAMGAFNSKNKFEVNGKTVLLTGASDGMGKSVAEILAAKGASIIIVARNKDKLEKALAGIKRCATSPSQRFHSISADLGKKGEPARVISEAIAWNQGAELDVVWCMAGVSEPKLFLDSTPDAMRWQMDVNFWSCNDMAHAILGYWLAPGAVKSGKPRHLIFTSSVLAFYTIVGYAPYSPSKAAIRSLSDTLSQEVLLYTPDVKVHTIFPGTINSPGFVEEAKTRPDITAILEKDDPVQTPLEVATASIAGLERGENFITVNFLGAAMKACSWGGSERSNWFLDTLLTWITSLVWFFIAKDLNGKVVKYGKEHGHPSTFKKSIE